MASAGRGGAVGLSCELSLSASARRV